MHKRRLPRSRLNLLRLNSSSRNMSSEWCTIESDPGVFSELISMLGVNDVAVEEIYSLDSAEQSKDTSYGLIFLFKWHPELGQDDRPVIDPQNIPDLFFARQIVTNACATQALLSVLLNAVDINLGDELSSFKAFTASFDPETKGISIGNSEAIRHAHNSFARSDPFVHDKVSASSGDGDAFHFVAYIPFEGAVYELDGLKSGPIYLGTPQTGEDWWTVAKPVIETRMARSGATDSSFVLLTVCPKKSSILKLEIEQLSLAIEHCEQCGGNNVDHITKDTPSLDGIVPMQGVVNNMGELEFQLVNLRNQLSEETHKEERQKVENARRRHNYVPFIIELLCAMARKGELQRHLENI